MQRTIIEAVPGRDAAADPTVEVTEVAPRRRLPRWLLVFGFWTVIVLAYSNRTMRIGPAVWIQISELESWLHQPL